MTAPLCFLDTETTGLHPGREAWEIAMIRRESDGTETVAEFFVSTRHLNMDTADPMALKVGRFYDRHPQLTGADFIDFVTDDHTDLPAATVLGSSAAAAIAEEMTRGAHIVGAVPNFDTEVLDWLLRSHNYLPAWHYHLIDVENLMVGFIRGHLESRDGDLFGRDRNIVEGVHRPPWSSHDLSSILDVEEPDESELHTAMGDARWAQRCYDRVMG